MRGENIQNSNGFTLIEMAIVLVIMGILVGSGASLIGPLTRRLKYSESKERLSGSLETVIGFGTTSYRFPTSSEFLSMVPHRKDSWNKNISYVVDPNMTTSGSRSVCGRKTTAININRCPDALCASPTQSISDIAALFVSSGENLNIQTSLSTGTINVYERDIPSIDDYTADMNRAEDYDDIVSYLTLNEVRVKAGCSGPPLRLVNHVLPSSIINTAYTSQVFADGGVPYTSGGKYRWCVQGTLPGWMAFTPNTTPSGSSSTYCSSLTESSWSGLNDTLTITSSTNPTTITDINVTIFVRDNNDSTAGDDNIGDRSFVITIGS